MPSDYELLPEQGSDMNPLRVLVWCPLVNPGGGARLLVQLVQALARQPGVELVRLAVQRNRFHAISSATDPALEVVWINSWLEEDKRLLGIRGTGRLKRLVRRQVLRTKGLQDWMHRRLRIASRDCDLVYVFWPHLQEYPSIDRPIVCTFQDATFIEFPEILGGAETWAEDQRAAAWLSRSSQVVVSSAATRSILVRHFGEHCNSAVVIHHAIVPEATRQLRHLPSALQSLPDGYIVYPANINSHKNHYNLLLAWARLNKTDAPHLVLFGPGTEVLNNIGDSFGEGRGWQASRLRGLVRRSGLQAGHDYSALGYVQDSDVMPVISRAAALIMPSLAEGGGSFPVEEALSLGVPVLCSDIPVLREQLAARTAKVGWFDPESPDSIVAAVTHLVKNYAEYREAALQAVNDPRPTWNDVAAQYMDVFRDVIARAGESGGAVNPCQRSCSGSWARRT